VPPAIENYMVENVTDGKARSTKSTPCIVFLRACCGLHKILEKKIELISHKALLIFEPFALWSTGARLSGGQRVN